MNDLVLELPLVRYGAERWTKLLDDRKNVAQWQPQTLTVSLAEDC